MLEIEPNHGLGRWDKKKELLLETEKKWCVHSRSTGLVTRQHINPCTHAKNETTFWNMPILCTRILG